MKAMSRQSTEHDKVRKYRTDSPYSFCIAQTKLAWLWSLSARHRACGLGWDSVSRG